MSSYVTRKTPGDTAWFRHDRFGMFIHFGLYAMPARHEWIMEKEHMTAEHYQRYFEHFNPDLFDAREWARQAKAAGMKYAVLTTKHHEGFCLFDTQYTEFKITNTPFGRDLVREYVDAFRAEGIRIGLYYSLLDWNHPEFTIDAVHPRRTDADAEEVSKKRDMRIYAEYMRNQLTELMTNYGKIDLLWLDFSYRADITPYVKPWMKGKNKEDWESEKLIALVRELQPGIIINNRSGLEQDLWTPEQYQPTDWVKHEETGELVTWETCQTFSGSWGYFRDEATWKSPEMLIEMLVNTVSAGGNLIMNVGPTARGYFDYRAEAALKVYADWMKLHSRAIYGCTMAEPEFTAPRGCRLTQSEDGKRLYIHLFEYPFAYLEMKNMIGRIEYAQFLNDGSEVILLEKRKGHHGDTVRPEDKVMYFKLPVVRPNVTVPVIEVFLKDK